MNQKIIPLTILFLLISISYTPFVATGETYQTTPIKEDVTLNIRGGLGFIIEVNNNGETPIDVNYSIEWFRYLTNTKLESTNGTIFNISNSFTNRFVYTHLRSPFMNINVTMWTQEQGLKRTGIAISILRIFLTEERF